MMKRFSWISIAAILLFVLGTASAEAKPKEPEAKGIQVGNFVIHPGGDLKVAYETRDTMGYDDGYVDIGAHLNTRLADDTYNVWNNNLSIAWRQFWGIGDADPNGGLDVNLLSEADLFKKSFFRLAPSVNYTYVNDPEDDYLRRDYENHSLRAGVGMYLQPGGGAVFSQRIGYKYTGKFYTERSDVSHNEHRIDSVTRWNFLPQSSMALNIDFRYISYFDDERIVAADVSDEEKKNSSSMPLRIKYSLQGLLLARLSYVLGLGYGYEHYDNGLTEHMFVMNARLRYDFTANAGLFLEYKKDFDNVIYGDFYKLNNVTLGFQGMWFDHLQTDAEVGFGAFDFQYKSGAARNDYLVTADVGVFYHFIPGTKLGLQYRLRYNNSDADSSSYVKNMITLNFSYEY